MAVDSALTAEGMVVAQGQAPDWAIHLANEQWSHSPLLWVYGAGALVVLAVVWWITRHRSAWLRALVRSLAAAFLLSPAILACGSISIMPFPVLIRMALQSTSAVSCGAPLVALPPNAMTFGGLWLVLFLTLWCWDWFHAPRALPDESPQHRPGA